MLVIAASNQNQMVPNARADIIVSIMRNSISDSAKMSRTDYFSPYRWTILPPVTPKRIATTDSGIDGAT